MSSRLPTLLLLVPLIVALLIHPFYSNFSFINPCLKPLVILLVTAHPDDEVLFFAPTILPLIAYKYGYNTDHSRPHLGGELYSLCLSTGAADGLGPVRALELERSLAVLGVEEGKRWIIDSPKLQDNMSLFWDADVIAETVRPYVLEHKITTILTFDALGVSSHPNHASIPFGILRLLHSLPPTTDPIPTLYTLETTSLIAKYSGIIAPILAKFDLGIPILAHLGLRANDEQPQKPVFVSGARQYLHALRAMREHRSQLVWFRWLYVLFSRYMWVNEWVELKP